MNESKPNTQTIEKKIQAVQFQVYCNNEFYKTQDIKQYIQGYRHMIRLWKQKQGNKTLQVQNRDVSREDYPGTLSGIGDILSFKLSVTFMGVRFIMLHNLLIVSKYHKIQ